VLNWKNNWLGKGETSKNGDRGGGEKKDWTWEIRPIREKFLIRK